MHERILLDLLRIVEMEGIDRTSGRLARIRAIHNWMNENLVHVKISERVIKSNFTSEEDDVLKYHMATKMAEKLMEDAISIELEPTKVTTEVIAFKRHRN